MDEHSCILCFPPAAPVPLSASPGAGDVEAITPNDLEHGGSCRVPLWMAPGPTGSARNRRSLDLATSGAGGGAIPERTASLARRAARRHGTMQQIRRHDSASVVSSQRNASGFGTKRSLRPAAGQPVHTVVNRGAGDHPTLSDEDRVVDPCVSLVTSLK